MNSKFFISHSELLVILLQKNSHNNNVRSSNKPYFIKLTLALLA